MQKDPRAADTGGVGLSANSFADVYVEHMPELTRYCRSILRDPADAEDAAQNAMERAMRALGEGPPPERMRPWLLTIAQREAMNVLRLRRRVTPAELDDSSFGPQGSAEELAAVRARLAELLADVRELTPRQREGLVARELGGRTYRQIAASLGTSEAAAQQLVLEARQSLRQFEAGRSLECGEVQSWISAHDHARVRTRRVRAHLRSCNGCRGFQHGIAARRRDFGLLLPGVGGGAWWTWLAGVVGHGGAKLAAAGAVAATGAVIVAGPALTEGHPNLPRLTATLDGAPAAPPTAVPPAPRLRKEIAVRTGALRAASPRTGRPAARTRRVRPASGEPQLREAPLRTTTRTAAPVPAQPSQEERRRPQPRAAEPPSATPAPAPSPPEPSPRPDPTPQALQPVAEAAEPVADAVQQTVESVTDQLPNLLD